MVNKLKNTLYPVPRLVQGLPNTIRAIQSDEDESTDLDIYLENERQLMPGQGQELNFPSQMPILPLRNAVVYPGTVTPLAIGRDRSKALLKDTKPNETVIGLVAQKDSKADKPEFSDLYRIGTAATILKVIKLPHGSIHIVVHAIGRFRIVKPTATKPYLKAQVEPLGSKVRITKKLKALIVNVRAAANRVIVLSPNVPEEASLLLDNIENPSALADFLAANLNIGIAKKQELLEELDVAKRLEEISFALASQLEVLELSHKIQGKVRDSVDKNQREYFLQEQLKAIQTELGREDRQTEELKQIEKNIKKAQMPKNVEAEAMRELDRLGKIPPASPEYSVLRTYLDWICELPWSVATEDRLDINKAQRILNRDHYDLKKVKKRILEFLAVRKLNPSGKSPILCFIGPPGVGKTSLGKSIARAMDRNFVRISLGGIRDEADIRGHRRTYIGALPGRIIQEIRKAKSNNPVFMLDEMDKIGADFRGDPSSALLEVLDPEQNNSFNDHYIDQPFDLSKVMFIGTANYAEPIPPALHDRMEIIELPGYTDNEKLQIAKRYLVPRQLKENGLSKNKLTITDDALEEILRSYTREAGVRNLERDIAAICRAVATETAKGSKRRATIGKLQVVKILGPPRFESELALRTGIPGVATALAYTPVGGEILFIESAQMPGEGKLHLTGQIGDVMKESAEAAFSLVKANAKSLKIDTELFGKHDFHIHVPAGAIPKDGPSAGVAMFTSLVSLLLKKPTKPDIAMTGEITLRGLVLPIGGLKEKILAAKQAGIKTVILPKRNQKDIPEVPTEAKKGLKFVFVKNTNEAIKTALKGYLS
ncbi:MAG: endopeptidase La [Sedimentisphaerales bacterium]|nr:endopeptidase La [Sedimentisphaerales bacterium]